MSSRLPEQLLEIRESHVIAEGVRNQWRHEMPSPCKQIGRVDSEHGGVSELDAGDDGNHGQRHSLSMPFDDVMEMGQTEEEWRQPNGRARFERVQQQWHHAGAERKLLRERSNYVIANPQDVLNVVQPIRWVSVSLKIAVQHLHGQGTDEQDGCEQQR